MSIFGNDQVETGIEEAAALLAASDAPEPHPGSVNPAPALAATVETGFGHLSETPAPLLQATPTINTVADTAEEPNVDLDAGVAALLPNNSITDWNAVSAFMGAVVPWPASPTDAGWVVVPNGYVGKTPDGRDPRTKKYPVGGGKPFKTVGTFVSYVGWAIQQHYIKDLWFVLSLQRDVSQTSKGKPKGKRSTAGAVAVKAIWLDVDVGKEGAYSTVNEALAAVIKFRETSGLPPFSAVVGSGGGIHVYWISNVALPTKDWRPYAEGLKALAAKDGLKCDLGVTTDICRMLRVPGTFNHKEAIPRPCQLFNVPLAMYDFPTQLAALSRTIPLSSANAHNSSSSVNAYSPFADGANMASFNGVPILQANPNDKLSAGIDKFEDILVDPRPIFKKCGFYRDAFRTGGKDHKQDLWMYAVLGTTFMANGRPFAHEISKGHADYSPAGTDAMYDRKVTDRHDRGLGYPQCSTIKGAGCISCASCPHLAKGKSPLNLGIPNTAQPADEAAEATCGPTTPPPPKLKVSFSKIPHRQWLYSVDLVRGDVTLLASPGGAGKTSLALGMAICLVTGKAALGERIWGSGPFKSLYINAEDNGAEMLRRACAFCQQHNITEQELDRLYMVGAEDLQVQGISFLRASGASSFILNQAGFAQLDSLLASLTPDLIILDPLIALCGGGDLNNNALMALVLRELKKVAIKYNCAILIVLHTNKGGDPSTANAISGASAIKDLARRAIMPVNMTEAEAKVFAILPSERRQYFRLVDAKSNLAPHSDEAWYKLENQELPNAEPPTYPHGDRVQAVVRVQLPIQPSGSASADDMKIDAAILDLVDSGKEIDGQAYPYSPSLAGAKNERAFLADAMVAVANATASRQWALVDLEAAIKTAINRMQADGRLVIEDMEDLMSKPGRFRRGRGLKAVPI